MNRLITKFSFLTLVLTLTLSCAGLNVAPPNPIYPIPTPEQVDWHKLETYAFVHFGLNTFSDTEWGYGDSSPSIFNPTNFDANQWADIIKRAGFKGLILTVKHNDGFCLWPSQYTSYNISKSPYKNGKGDIVKEVVDACRKAGLKFGIYLSPWDRNRADYGSESYVQYYHNQLRELYDNYTDGVDVFGQWFDGANGGEGYYGGARDGRKIDSATYYQYDDAVKIVHAKFPSAMIFGGTCPTIRWVGNENGLASETNWNMTSHIVERDTTGSVDGKMWMPAECDVSIRPSWFYHQNEDGKVKSIKHLLDIYYGSVGRGASLLMNFPVDKTGRINSIDSARIMQFKAIVDRDLGLNLTSNATVTASDVRGANFDAFNVIDGQYDTYWATHDGVATGRVEIKFGQPVTFNRVVLQEYIPLGQRVEKFSLEYLDAGQWSPVHTTESTTTIGYKRILRTEPISTHKVRINFLKSRGELTINNIEFYLASDSL